MKKIFGNLFFLSKHTLKRVVSLRSLLFPFHLNRSTYPATTKLSQSRNIMDSVPPYISHGELDVTELTSQMEEGLAVKFSEDELQVAVKDFDNTLVVKLVGGAQFQQGSFQNRSQRTMEPFGRVAIHGGGRQHPHHQIQTERG